jgi:hypothetical protein
MAIAQLSAIPWLDSLTEALRQARASGKPVFLDLFSPT